MSQPNERVRFYICKILAAHCIHDKHSEGYRRLPSHILSYFGIYDLKQSKSRGWHIEEIFLHADWNALDEAFEADIALLKHRELIAFSDSIKPICLWTAEKRDDFEKGVVISWTEPDEDEPGYWNYNHDLLHNYPQRYIMPIRSNAECFRSQPRFKKIAGERSYCAGGLNSGACLEVGNSGASMAVEIEEKYFLRGIVSASFIDIAGCDNVTFTLFTDVLKFEAWIIDIVSGSRSTR
jgi:Trypsin